MPQATKEEQQKLDQDKLERLKASGIVGALVDMVDERMAESREESGGNGNGKGAGIREIVSASEGDKKDGGDPSFKERVKRSVMALSVCKGDPGKAARWAEDRFGSGPTAKALTAADEEGGGFLVQAETQDEVIELLRPMSAVRQLNPVMAPMDAGKLTLPKLTSGASGGYVGESSAQNADQPEFGSVELSAAKYVGIVPISNDLIRRPTAGGSIDQMVQDDIAGAAGQDSDIAFIRGDGSGGEPVGLLHQAQASNRLSANATVNLANVTNDIGLCIQTLGDADVRMIRPGWIMEWRTWRYLITVRDGNGNLVFKPEMDNGTLFGFPFAVTSQLPRNLDASGDGDDDETELYFADFADVVIGETTGILLDVFPAAAYNNSGGTVVSSVSRDESVVRIIVEHDIGLRHDESVVVLQEVSWGA